MNWILEKPLKDDSLIENFEKKFRVDFPETYIEVVKEYNNGRPRPNVFNTEKTDERVAKCLLSFDTSHKENIWDTYKILKKQLPADTYPFMLDQFGNFLCFQIDTLTKKMHVVFWNMEEQSIENVAESFDEFLSNFYEI